LPQSVHYSAQYNTVNAWKIRTIQFFFVSKKEDPNIVVDGYNFVYYNNNINCRFRGVSADVSLWNKNMGQKWRKIRRRCSSFNTGTGKGKSTAAADGPLLPPSPSSSDDSAASTPTAAATVQDMLRSRLNMLNIGGYKRRPQLQLFGGGCNARPSSVAADTSTFYVPSPLLRPDDGHADAVDAAAGPCSLPVAFDLAADHRLMQPSSLCRVAETPSSCGSSGRGTADDGAGSDRSSVSYSDHGYNSIASTATATGYDADRWVLYSFFGFREST